MLSVSKDLARGGPLTLLQMGMNSSIDPTTVLVINHWKHTGNGYRTDEERDIAGAIYERKRTHRREKLEKEHTP